MKRSRFGKAFAKVRVDHNLNLKEVGLAMGISASAVSAMESGRRTPSGDWIRRAVRACGFSPIEHAVLIASVYERPNSEPTEHEA